MCSICFCAAVQAGDPAGRSGVGAHRSEPYSFSQLVRVTERAARDAGVAEQLPLQGDDDGIPDGAAGAAEVRPATLRQGVPSRGASAPALLAVPDMPPPAGWLMLASGLAIAGFIARRRAKPVH